MSSLKYFAIISGFPSQLLMLFHNCIDNSIMILQTFMYYKIMIYLSNQIHQLSNLISPTHSEFLFLCWKHYLSPAK